MKIHRNPIASAIASIVLIAATFTALGAASPASAASGPHATAIHHSTELPASKRVVANPQHIKRYSCTYENIGSWWESPSGNSVEIYPNVYNCSGNNYVDSIQWTFYSGGGVQLQQWWFYTKCGDWFSAASGSPYTYLNSSNTGYSAYIGQNVPNPNNFDVDTQYNPGGQWSACM